MEEFEESSRFGIGNDRVRVNSDAWNREWKFEAWNRECRSSYQVHCLESEMKKFEPDSETWKREWRSSSLESGMEDFEPSSKLGIIN